MISLGLTGFPLGHSLSPRIHETALALSGLEGQYNLYPIPLNDDRALIDLVGRVRSGTITGLNVTIPYKQKVIPLMDVLSPAAQAIGAVNTIYMKDGKLNGENTDAPGFLKDLHALIDTGEENQFQNQKALVLGAGGAARAVVFALLNDDWKIIVAARREQQARELLSQFITYSENLSSIDFSARAIEKIAPDINLIVNTTPLGMSPEIDNNPWPQGVALPGASVCYDLVYQPRETCFVCQARNAGLRADSGLGMLVRQAALAFEVWTGESVPIDQLIPAVEAV